LPACLRVIKEKSFSLSRFVLHTLSRGKSLRLLEIGDTSPPRSYRGIHLEACVSILFSFKLSHCCQFRGGCSSSHSFIFIRRRPATIAYSATKYIHHLCMTGLHFPLPVSFANPHQRCFATESAVIRPFIPFQSELQLTKLAIGELLIRPPTQLAHAVHQKTLELSRMLSLSIRAYLSLLLGLQSPNFNSLLQDT
jgi:hypothetical protein